jgi:hypothetical protein
MCGNQLTDSSLGSEAVTRATNAIVNEANKVMGLTLVPLKRTVSKEGLARKKAREMCKSAVRRKFKDLIDEWDNDFAWQNSMIQSGWTREDMVFAMKLAATEGQDPNDHRMSWQERQQRSSITKVLRFRRDDGSTFTPHPSKSPFFQNAVEAGKIIGEEEGFTCVSGGRSGGNLLKTAYPHGREHAWAADQEASGTEVPQTYWGPSSSKSRGKRWEDQKDEWWEDKRPWKKKWQLTKDT